MSYIVELKQFWQRWWSFAGIVILVSAVLKQLVVTTTRSNKQKSKIVFSFTWNLKPNLFTKLHQYAYISTDINMFHKVTTPSPVTLDLKHHFWEGSIHPYSTEFLFAFIFFEKHGISRTAGSKVEKCLDKTKHVEKLFQWVVSTYHIPW